MSEVNGAQPIPEGDAILSDGSTVHVRSLTANDREALVTFFDSLSSESRRRRFFRPLARLEGALLDRLLDVDHVDTIAIVALREDRIVGVGRANRGVIGSTENAQNADTSGVRTAEVAFTVEDAMHGLGIATILLEALASRAHLVGIDHFDAITQSDNGEMLRVFRGAGYNATFRRDPQEPGVIIISFPITEDDRIRSARALREHNATAASLRPLLRPESIAVIGASSSKDSPGRVVVRELLSNGFGGGVYPVNLKGGFIEGLSVVAQIRDIAVPIDLAVIAVPAAAVLKVVEECAAAGVRGLLVLSSGFAELGSSGKTDQDALLAVCRRAGMRLIGPNCLGIITTDPQVSMHAVFTGFDVTPGGLALMSQSGAVAITIASLATRQGVGFSSIVSVGNKADVSGNDLLEYWADDDPTKVIALYLESFGNPRRFARIARHVSRSKPIIAIKAARSMAGIKAAASHTAALMAPDTTVDALFQQTGVLRVDDPRELLLLAAALERTQLPAGRRVAIVGNAGGLGILTADALANEDLPLAEFAPATLDALRAGSPPNSSLTNPVDLTATVDVSQMETALRAVLNDPGVDAVVVVHVLVRPGEEAQLFNMLADLTATATKPVLLIADNPSEQVEAKVAVVATPREGALVLARLAERGDWLRRSDEPDQLIPGSSIAEIRELVQVGLATDVDSEPQSPQNRWLPTTMAFEIFRMAGINVAAPIKADDADQAADVATTMGFPVCIKAANPNLMHRSDIGAVQVGLRDEFGVVCAYRAMEQTLGDAMHGVVVQPMAPPGVEIIIGIENDPHFGPIVMVGAGGRTAELWRDTAVHLAPVNKATAAEMLRSLRSHRLLTGFRNAPQADETALIDTIVRLAQLAVDVPDIAELDANPVMVHPGGVTAVDVKIRVAANANAVRDTIRMMR